LFISEQRVWPTNAAKAISLAAETFHAIMVAGCGGKPAMNKHRMNKELSSFAARLRGLIANEQSAIGNQQFSELALELFALQFEHNAVYRKICEARGLTPRVVEHWTQIPAVPASAFKELELSCIPPDERTAVFHSSGTTEQKPSRHFHNAESLAVYEASLGKWFQLHFGDGGELVFLTPDQKAAPHSSLVYMFETVRRKFGQPESAFTGNISTDGSWEVDSAATIQRLNIATDTGKPLTLLGTAFSFVHLLDFLAENNLQLQLPENSHVMETGGYKNRSRAMSKPELHALISARLGVQLENIICEYGMSELSSQAYGGKMQSAKCEVRNFQFPPWSRAQIISPETGREVADGETGLIRIFDLANVFSVAAVQTEDLGIRRGDGFELIGRARLAEPRGCSLMTA
jgi:Acyl-protein synthetase, LuxE